MWNRVVNVKQVEVVELGDLSHARGQSQIVGRIVKQRIARDFDFVVVNVRLYTPQADGLSVRNKMNVMSALSQFQAELCRDHAAATVGGITSDPNLHCLNICLSCFCNSMATRDHGCRFYTLCCGESDRRESTRWVSAR